MYLRPATLKGNPSKIQCSIAASNNYLSKTIKNINIFQFFAQILVYLRFFLYLCAKLCKWEIEA